jgi:hypothetical protein
MADTTAKLGIMVDSSQAVTASDNLDDLAVSAGKAERAAGGMAKGAKKASGGIDNVRHVAGQAGFQIQDMAVQLESGTGFLRAFGQQGSQFASIFGPTGAVVGAVIAVSAAIGGVLFNSLNKASSAADLLADSMDRAGDSFEKLSLAQAIVAKRAAGEVLDSLREQRKELEGTVKIYETGGRIYETERTKNWEIAIAQLEAVNQAMREQVAEIDNLQDVISGEDQKKQFIDISKAYQAYARTRIQSNQEIQDSEAQEEADQAFTDALLARGQAESEYIANSQAQYQNYWNSFGQAQLVINAGVQDSLNAQLESEAEYQERSKNAYMEYYATLRQNKEDLDNSYVVGEKNKFIISQSLASVFATAMTSQSKELFNLGKIGSIGQAIMSAYEAINKTLAQGGMFAGPAAAAIGAAAFANVASIASQKFGSTSSGGGSTPSVPAANGLSGGDTQQGSTLNVSLVGDNFQRVTVENLLSTINEQIADGGRIDQVNLV